jgi:hypothetical protein
LNFAQGMRFLWLGARGILGRRDKTTVVICPTVELPAEVGLDPDRRMESCSRWPEVQDCGQSCLPQVQFSAEDLNAFATRYEGQRCISCGAGLTRDDWYQSRLAALETKAGMPEIPASVRSSFSIPENRDPVCSACHDAQNG